MQAENAHGEGFWKRADDGGGYMRFANHTKCCQGPWLAIYRDAPPEREWAPLPPEWAGAVLRFRVMYNTLVPCPVAPQVHRRPLPPRPA